MKRSLVHLVIFCFLLWGHQTAYSKTTFSSDPKGSAHSKNNIQERVVSQLDSQWNSTRSPFIPHSKGFTLKTGPDQGTTIEFPAVLNSKNPISIQTPRGTVRQFLASGGSYKAVTLGKYLVYRNNSQSILYRFDTDQQQLREFVYLSDAGVYPQNGEIIQWRFDGADLEFQKDGSVVLSRSQNLSQKIESMSNIAMAHRIGRFLNQLDGASTEAKTSLSLIPKPEYVDGTGKTHTKSVRYIVQDQKLTLYMKPDTNHNFPLWVDPSFLFRAGPDSDAQFDGRTATSNFGISAAHAGDFNGDGIGDIIVGADGDDTGASNSGSAFIFFGSDTPGAVGPDVTIQSSVANSKLGVSVASAGDFNGDGGADVIIGASFANGGATFSGKAFVFYGTPPGATPPSTPLSLTAETDADVTFSGENFLDQLGTSVASAGDFNNDGVGDVIVGIPSADILVNGFLNNDAGKAQIYFGSNVARADLTVADVILSGENAMDRLGTSVSSAGDFNGDGINDVIIGADGTDSNGTDSGSAYIFYGGGSPTSLADAGVVLTGENASDSFGGSVASAGDFNGDGTDDVIVGARNTDNPADPTQTDSGSAYIFFGSDIASATELSNPDIIFDGDSMTDRLGTSVASAGDYNGDGKSDVIVGIPNEDNNGQLDSGSAFIFFGYDPVTTPDRNLGVDVADVIMDGPNPGDRLGSSVSGAVDFNNDGASDVIAGTPRDDNNGLADSGSAFVFFGIAVTDTTPPDLMVLGTNPTNVEAGTPYNDAGASANDDTDGNITANILVTGLPIDTSSPGTHVVDYEVSDAAGNVAQASRTVNVVDTTPPAINGIADLGPVEATAELTPVSLGGNAVDTVDPAPVLTNDAPSEFPIGTTEVTWTATDASGNITVGKQNVTVVDTTAPNISAPADLTVSAKDLGFDDDDDIPRDKVLTASATATDAVSIAMITDNAPAFFRVGTTTVTWTATDKAGNISTADQKVVIREGIKDDRDKKRRHFLAFLRYLHHKIHKYYGHFRHRLHRIIHRYIRYIKRYWR